MRKLFKTTGSVLLSIIAIPISQIIAQLGTIVIPIIVYFTRKIFFGIQMPTNLSLTLQDNKIFQVYYIIFNNLLSLFLLFLIIKFLSKYIFHRDVIKDFYKKKIKIIYFIIPIFMCLTAYIIYFLFVDGKFVLNKINTFNFFISFLDMVLGTAIVAPIIEETIFRGIVANVIEENYGLGLSFICSSFIFGAVHILNGELSFLSIVMLLVSGFEMGALLFIVKKTFNSLNASIIVHGGYNFLSSIILISNKNSKDWPLLYKIRTSNLLITGGDYGVSVSIVSLLIIVVTIFFLFMESKNKNMNNSLKT
ncbi:hypothetical protein BG261_00175 [Floricoccus tropicus]|uniref:CAAX prenyl protease 2/Lysostaphin resistance protein A-like domain-containing protein n=1 Tax=Floricoccus tropicus TaxID=1859473 RepID=A0A1E8GS79_9LACT|nr:CPBP family intramembrane glutamic endopeptidase [Floricoccus tropicus]OFI50338.1 hypothetical protein BG261_00175 [Floricoccus tropicus]